MRESEAVYQKGVTMAMATRRLADGGVRITGNTHEVTFSIDMNEDGRIGNYEAMVKPPGLSLSAPPRPSGCCGDKATLPHSPREAEAELLEGVS